MSAVITAPEVQGWLESTKLAVTNVDAQLEESAREMAFTMLSREYDVTAWVDSATTPTLVRKLIAGLVAAWLYARQYSEDGEQPSWYADSIEKRVMNLLQQLADGTLDLVGVDKPADGSAGIDAPSFYPTDATGTQILYDALGNEIGREGSEDIKFTMGQLF